MIVYMPDNMRERERDDSIKCLLMSSVASLLLK